MEQEHLAKVLLGGFTIKAGWQHSFAHHGYERHGSRRCAALISKIKYFLPVMIFSLQKEITIASYFKTWCKNLPNQVWAWQQLIKVGPLVDPSSKDIVSSKLVRQAWLSRGLVKAESMAQWFGLTVDELREEQQPLKRTLSVQPATKFFVVVFLDAALFILTA